jgi:hypothetical protein
MTVEHCWNNMYCDGMVKVTFQFGKVTSCSLNICLLLVEMCIIENKAESQMWAMYCHSVAMLLEL